MSPFYEGEKLIAQGNVIIFSVVVRVIFSRAAPTSILFGHKTLSASKSLSPTTPISSFSPPCSIPPLSLQSKSHWTLAAFLTFPSCFYFHGLFLVDVFTITHMPYDNLSCSTTLLHCPHIPTEQPPLPNAHSVSPSGWGTFSQVDTQCCHNPAFPTGSLVKPGNLTPATPFCFLSF